jgi:hypothetical protein
MPYLVRRWVARHGHEGRLRHELVGLYEAHVRTDARVMESMLYREHFAGRDFIGVTVYDEEAALQGPQRRRLLDALRAVADVHAELAEGSFRAEVLYEYAAIARKGAHGVAVLLPGKPARLAELTERLREMATVAVERLAPTRALAWHLVEAPGHVLIIVDTEAAIELDRYLSSPLRREHLGMLAPFLTAPARWYSLDPIWHHFRRRTSAR